MIRINEDFLKNNYKQIIEDSLIKGYPVPSLLRDYLRSIDETYSRIGREIIQEQSDDAKEIFEKETFARDKAEFAIMYSTGNKREQDKFIRELHEKEFQDWLKLFPLYNGLIE